MGYENIATIEVYNSMEWDMRHCMSDAEIWVLAENVMQIREIVCDWYDALENGIANDRQFDPTGIPISQEDADWFVRELDAEFDDEFATRGHALALTANAELFDRLTPDARLAFGQLLKATLKTDRQIKREAQSRLASGETIPPPPVSPWHGNDGSRGGFC